MPPTPLTDRPLLEVAPRLAARPFLPIAELPTPVQPMPALAAAGRVWVKRDDVVSSLYGGNKVRRWEWLLAEARAQGRSELLTIGGPGSTQLTSLAAHGQAHGFQVHGVIFEQPPSAFVEEALREDAHYRATLHFSKGAYEAPAPPRGAPQRSGGYARTVLTALYFLARHPRAYVIAPGASGPLATLSYVDAMLELGAQVRAGLLPRPDRVVVPCGSGGTAVGLALGAALLGWRDTTIEAVRITDLYLSNPITLGAIARASAALLRREGYRGPRLGTRIEMNHRFIGPGYGAATPEAEHGSALFERAFGLPGEVTYSGKGLAALEQAVLARPRETILYWNTLSTTGRLVS